MRLSQATRIGWINRHLHTSRSITLASTKRALSTYHTSTSSITSSTPRGRIAQRLSTTTSPLPFISTLPSYRAMATQSAPATDYGHFKLLQSFDIKYAPVKVSKWRSERTGLTVVVGDHASPVVSFPSLFAHVSLTVDQRTLYHCF